MTTSGSIYYLPVFLKYFFDLKNIDNEFFIYLMFDLENGFDEHTPENLDDSLKGKKKLERKYLSFEKINPIQSKLVATFFSQCSKPSPGGKLRGQASSTRTHQLLGNFLLF
ncbi:hypothetical protein GO496_09540 [Acidovorax citrulli]|nr:hypothetical protein [Paracidovorax citrulli]